MSIAILLAVPGMAQAKGNKGDKPIAGKVTAVDAAAGTITLKSKKLAEEKTFKVEGATITVDGVTAKLEDVKKKMEVKITVGSDPGTATAVMATIKEKKSKGAKGTPPTT